MTGLDSNILVQRADIDHPFHAATLAAIDRELQNGQTLLLEPSVIAEFLHVITDSRRLAQPLSMPAALDWIAAFRKNPSITTVFPSEASLAQAAEWMRKFSLGRKRVIGTHIAATFLTQGCRRLITSNPDDFRIFGVFEIVTP